LASTSGGSVLDRIVEVKRAEVRTLRERASQLAEAARVGDAPRGFATALRRAGEVALLAEVKRRSPSAGEIRPGADPADVARAYQRGGAAALSVLTDHAFFGGELGFLAQARAASALPVLRKDFVIDPLQLREAWVGGADAVLLIARILPGALLAELHAAASALGLDVLVEVHDAAELERALACGATLVGVNNRDLARFVTDLELSIRLAPGVPPAVTLVAESGIRGADEVRRLGAAGVDAVLVGESLMRQHDLAAAAAGLVGLPRDPGARRGA
jgi:indole-3-glycerol phosphate synthase